MRRLLNITGHLVIAAILTALTQLGGVAWLASRFYARPYLAFALLYGACLALALVVAPLLGRVSLPCFGGDLRMQSPLYCVMMRNYVTPELRDVAEDAAADITAQFPGTVTLALDGGFPFFTGFPLLPHLSHDDGEKLDFAFFYQDASGRYLPGRTRSPLGYFAFETLDDRQCPAVWPTLRWDMRPLQHLWPDRPLEPERTAALIRRLAGDARVARVFVEPALVRRLGTASPRIGFQGCRAARHDDHIHIQL